MAYGRMAGHISFLSPDSMDKKIWTKTTSKTDGLYDLLGIFRSIATWSITAINFPKRFDPLSYLYIVKMMNIFDCTRHYDSLKDALAPIKANLHLIAFKGDLLFPPSCMREIYDALCEMGREAKTNFCRDR